jgi:hypothetical protein
MVKTLKKVKKLVEKLAAHGNQQQKLPLLINQITEQKLLNL